VIRADRVRVGQVLTNLVDNAIKFSPDGSRVELAVKPHRDGGIYAVVTDTGPGIAKEDLGKLFQKFQQIDSALTRKQGGLGLGLVISKGIVEGHGGRIWVESGEGQGCRFCFILPSEPPRPRNADPPMDQAAA
jgi:signal transduction histidine kinase